MGSHQNSQLVQRGHGESQRQGDEGGGAEEDKWWEHVAVPGRWLGLVAGMWLLACAGSSATYAIYSPALKSVGGYNQQQLDSLAVAKDMGESVGILQGLLCDALPVWGLVLSGSLHYLVGFSALWAVAASHIKPLSFPAVSGASELESLPLQRPAAAFLLCSTVMLGTIQRSSCQDLLPLFATSCVLYDLSRIPFQTRLSSPVPSVGSLSLLVRCGASCCWAPRAQPGSTQPCSSRACATSRARGAQWWAS